MNQKPRMMWIVVLPILCIVIGWYLRSSRLALERVPDDQTLKWVLEEFPGVITFGIYGGLALTALARLIVVLERSRSLASLLHLSGVSLLLLVIICGGALLGNLREVTDAYAETRTQTFYSIVIGIDLLVFVCAFALFETAVAEGTWWSSQGPSRIAAFIPLLVFIRDALIMKQEFPGTGGTQVDMLVLLLVFAGWAWLLWDRPRAGPDAVPARVLALLGIYYAILGTAYNMLWIMLGRTDPMRGLTRATNTILLVSSVVLALSAIRRGGSSRFGSVLAPKP